MRAVSLLGTSDLAFSVVARFSVAANVESIVSDVIEAPIDDGMREKDVAARFSDCRFKDAKKSGSPSFRPRKCRIRAASVLQKIESELLESLQANKYQRGAKRKTLARSASGKFGAIYIDSTLEHRGNDRFFKDKFPLTAVHGRHGRSRIQKLARSEQYGSARALQPSYLTLLRARDYDVRTDHELLELRGLAKMLLRLVFRNKSFTAVIRSLIQYSNTFHSTCDIFFQKARVADIGKGLV